MSSPSHRELKGRSDYKLDAKNRVAIPWNLEGVSLNIWEDSREGLPMLKVFTDDEYNTYIDRINSQEELSYDIKAKLIGNLSEECLQTSVNAQGKLLIPKQLIDKVKLPHEVTVVGRGMHIEIWDPALYAVVYAIEQEQINAKLKLLGIRNI